MIKTKSKNILVTGSKGFIGENLIKVLIENGYTVYGIDSKISKHRYYKSKLQFHYKFLKYDISKISSLKKIYSKIKKINFESIWHFAANSDISKGSNNIDIEIRDTFFTTKYSIDLAKKLKIKKFIFASSSAIFGNTKKSVDENYGPCMPLSNYGAMKLASEGLISSNSDYFDAIFIFRFPNVVGSDNTHGLIYDMIKKSKKSNNIKVLGNGLQKKPYIHVSNLIDILFHIYKKNKKQLINIYNIGPEDKGVTVKFIISNLKKLKIFFNKKFIYQKAKIGWRGDIPKYSYNITKVKKDIKIKILSSKNAIEKTINDLY